MPAPIAIGRAAPADVPLAPANLAARPERRTEMELDLIEVGDDITKVLLRGRLDSPGVARIESRFAAAAAADDRHLVVDLGDVGFLTSMGIRMLIATARTKQRHGRKLVLFGAPPAVQKVLDYAALSELIPIVADEAAAMRAVAG
ncbi:MAG: STAS domain-containing protein [Burkholderiales bacterium]|nr:STAS domain-containing protein [Burkholderiales bacterium]